MIGGREARKRSAAETKIGRRRGARPPTPTRPRPRPRSQARARVRVSRSTRPRVARQPRRPLPRLCPLPRPLPRTRPRASPHVRVRREREAVRVALAAARRVDVADGGNALHLERVRVEGNVPGEGRGRVREKHGRSGCRSGGGERVGRHGCAKRHQIAEYFRWVTDGGSGTKLKRAPGSEADWASNR